ncbi:MAG: PAS domain S-box protein [Candidatus Desulfaltia sp.]|nr:PAS domain S-box protein [Candidatus Desulfaltia sp.]
MSVKNILVADDDYQIRDLLTEVIEKEGYKVFLASNGKEAVEIAKNNPLDLAILDLKMPEMDGITALKQIKEINGNIEILVITGYGDLQSLREVIEQEGVFDYLIKPFALSDIKHCIKRALQRKELNLKKNFAIEDLKHRICEMESDFKQKTIQLRGSQLKYKNIIKDSVDMVVILQGGKIKFINPKVMELTGYTSDELLGSKFIDMIHPDDRTHVMDKYGRWLRKDKETSRIYTFRVLKKDGEALWVESNSVWTEWEGTAATLNIVRDISERKQAVEELRIAEAAIASSINGCAFFDLKGRLTKANNSFLKIWGYENTNETLGKPAVAFMQKEKDVAELFKALREDGGWIGEMIGIKKNSSLFDIQVSASMVKDVNGNPVCMMASFIDITDGKKFVEGMMRSDKLSSLGQLSAGLAHELKNPLAVISSCAQFCMENMVLDPSLDENLHVIFRNSNRASKLINDLLAFAKPSLLEWKEVDVNEVITNMLNMAKLETTPYYIDFKRKLKKGLPKIMGDKEKLGQVFLNLIMNAIQAVPRKGTVILQTNILARENQVEVNIIDDGPGIPDDYRKFIFNPFFTTKDAGTGLGLSICHSIIEQHKGSIIADNAEGLGAKITVRLPVIQDGNCSGSRFNGSRFKVRER